MTKDLKIKICGMRDAANIGAVSALSPDYMGFIEYAPSPRFVGERFVVPENVPRAIGRVGVFVDASYEAIVQRAAGSGYDVVQLHGDESPELCSRLSDAGLRVIKVFRVDDAFDFNDTRPFRDTADVFLFDARGRMYGGNGVRFNWKVLQRYDQAVPFLLSGGLRVEALQDIEELSDMNLYGFDLNSGVELAPGVKDTDRVRAFMERIRGIRL